MTAITTKYLMKFTFLFAFFFISFHEKRCLCHHFLLHCVLYWFMASHSRSPLCHIYLFAQAAKSIKWLESNGIVKLLWWYAHGTSVYEDGILHRITMDMQNANEWVTLINFLNYTLYNVFFCLLISICVVFFSFMFGKFYDFLIFSTNHTCIAVHIEFGF